ncbi:MAG: molecular chaperone HtpG, partial [Coprobacillus sp.]|nr:molecular chaperone HtpG [Coprobacillus sp.]
MAEKKQFKAESKRLLDLMINSIYTHKEIFLRELISNASDATDKLYYKALTENISEINKSDLTIDLAFDKENRTLTVTDHGIGMNKEELEEHLGTIANSGSFKFKNENESDDIDIIGQFGVGFYSAFMVAKKVEVSSRAYGSDQGYTWVSEASDGYEIFETDNLPTGTTIKLYLKDNTEEENYDEYLDQYHIESLVKKYSDYVHYPIKMDVTTSKKKEDSDEYEDVVENKTLNSMVPLWKRNKKDIKDEEYNEFYKDKFNDFSDPMKVIHTSVEGNVSYDALLFIPSQPPMNFYSNDYEKGLQLYSRGVFIMDKASDLIPEHFRFVKGLVDSQDLSLNISREMLQHDRQLKVIADRIEKKIQSELTNMLKKDRETYEKFFKNYTIKQWGTDPSELDTSVISRIPLRFNRDTRYFADQYQGMPRLGYTKMCENMLKSKHIHILLNTDYRDVLDGITYDTLIYTGPVDAFYQYKYGKLKYRSIDFKMETLDVASYQEAAVINYPNDYAFTRITEFKKLTGQTHAKTTIMKEYPCFKDEPYYPYPTKEW